MKPNDQAIKVERYEELIKALRSSSLYILSHVAADALETLLAKLNNNSKPSEDYAGLVKELRERVRYDWWATEDVFSGEAADALEALLAERDELDKWLRESKQNFMRVDIERNNLRAERDALLARLAPMDDEALVEITAKAISKQIPCLEVQWGDIRDAAIDAIAAIRPHIEAAERERCAKIVEGACTATNNPLIVKILHGNYQSLVDRDFKIAASIRSGK